jgi:hypothetical protein
VLICLDSFHAHRAKIFLYIREITRAARNESFKRREIGVLDAMAGSSMQRERTEEWRRMRSRGNAFARDSPYKSAGQFDRERLGKNSTNYPALAETKTIFKKKSKTKSPYYPYKWMVGFAWYSHPSSGVPGTVKIL